MRLLNRAERLKGDIMKYGIFKARGEQKINKIDAWDLVLGDNADPECVEVFDSLETAREAFITLPLFAFAVGAGCG